MSYGVSVEHLELWRPGEHRSQLSGTQRGVGVHLLQFSSASHDKSNQELARVRIWSAEQAQAADCGRNDTRERNARVTRKRAHASELAAGPR